MTHPSQQASFGGSVDSYRAQGFVSAGAIGNPAANALMADTGNLAEGWYDIIFNIAGNAVHWYFLFEHRNAADTATIASFTGVVAAHGWHQAYINNRYIVANESLRIRCVNLAAGTFRGDIWYTRRADP